MIKLDVAEYCQDCPDFDADVHKTSGFDGKASTVVSCSKGVWCSLMHYHISKHRKEAEEKSNEKNEV